MNETQFEALLQHLDRLIELMEAAGKSPKWLFDITAGDQFVSRIEKQHLYNEQRR